MEYHKDKKELLLKRKLNELDKFALDFCNIVKENVEYVIISGYISILLGRSRATEDIDIFIKQLSFSEFKKLYSQLDNAGFWCLNAEKPEEVYSYLKEGYAIRFSRKNSSIPNFEVKFPKTELDQETFHDFIKVKLSDGELRISSLERQIAFKKYYLKSDKDKEDALYIEELFKDELDHGKINKLGKLIKEINRDGENNGK